MRQTKLVEVEVALDDLTGHELLDHGWAIVRRADGAVVAEFSSINQIKTRGAELERVVLGNVNRVDGDLPRFAPTKATEEEDE